MKWKWLLWLLVPIVGAAAALALLLRGGRHEGQGEVSAARLPSARVAARSQQQRAAHARLAPGAETPKQVLFGDLHVHTTFSSDAFTLSLPIMQGEGAHPPADACDFARFCADLDFWSINDHAEAITPQHWRETKESIRRCNAVAGDPQNPDIVAFLGWEWTQVGSTPEDHYGHKNVIFRDIAEDAVPRRPISAAGPLNQGVLRARPPLWRRLALPLADLSHRQRYLDFAEFQRELSAVDACPSGVDTRELPEDCLESAETPRELYDKLDQWGFDSLVIPHGTTWGFYTPPGTTFDKQLTKRDHDPARQRLFEIYSGHGSAEEFRPYQAITWDEQGAAVCPAPSPGYEPCCHRAGEIVRARCGDAAPAECEQRVQEARANYLAAGVSGHLTVPGATVEDWRDCGQCRDCFLPAFNHRPGNSAQYALAITNFDTPEQPLRFQFGFIGSSDNHSARPGTGFKEVMRQAMTEAGGAPDEASHERFWGARPEASPRSAPFTGPTATLQGFQLVELERQGSFFLTGGLVAVHSAGRDRDAVWSALGRREVYGTSGERMLLWFDLLHADGSTLPMGSETRLAEAPRFRVRAVGSFKQLPGCPESSVHALTPERLAHLCRGECYNPSDERHLITRIEVVRIRPQQRPNEPVATLVDDPWRSFHCKPDQAGCTVEFSDPEFITAGRDAVYYVRALQEPTPVVNGDNLRCTRDASGACVEAHPCYGDYRTPPSDDCLANASERAWSSPIFVGYRAP